MKGMIDEERKNRGSEKKMIKSGYAEEQQQRKHDGRKQCVLEYERTYSNKN